MDKPFLTFTEVVLTSGFSGRAELISNPKRYSLKNYIFNIRKLLLPWILNLALIEVQALDALTVIKTCLVIFILCLSFWGVLCCRESAVTSVVRDVMTLEAKFF